MSELYQLFELDTTADKWLYRLTHQYPWRSLYRGLVPKFIRNPIEQKLNFAKQERISLAWKKMLSQYFSGQLAEFHLTPKKSFQDQKIIWQYWGQDCSFEQLPETVQICFNSVDKYKADYQVIRLNDNNINEYLDLPDFIAEKRQNPAFKYAFFADLLRLALLDVYGGIWIDATILLTSPLDKKITECNYFLFQRDPNSEYKGLWGKYDGYFNWRKEHHINHLNSFIVAKKGNSVIHTCLNMLLHFWQTQNHIPHYFFFQILLNRLQKEYEFKPDILVDDTIPHLLHHVIKQEFNTESYRKILSQTHIHKLTYTKKYRENTYFAYLKQKFIS